MLIVHDVEVNTGVQTSPSLCSITDTFDCHKTSKSQYSTFLGLPVSVFSASFYLITLLLALGCLVFKKPSSSSFFSVMTFLSAVALLPTAYLFTVSAAVLNSFCLYCVGLYAVNILLPVVCLKAVRDKTFLELMSEGLALLSSFFTFGFLPKREGITGSPFAKLSVFLFFAILVTMLRAPFFIYDSFFTDQEKYHAVITKALKAWKSNPLVEIDISEDLNLNNRDFVIGTRGAPVTIVKYSDFECPACQRASSQIKAVVEKYKNKVLFVYKNFPLDNSCNKSIQREMHLYACQAAKMAVCAGEQGDELFWAMHDALFSLGQFSKAELDLLPTELSLGVNAYQSCINSEAASQKIEADIKQALRLEIQSTPTVYLNGRQIYPVKEYVLEAAIKDVLGIK